jgi:hypothetical protein
MTSSTIYCVKILISLIVLQGRKGGNAQLILLQQFSYAQSTKIPFWLFWNNRLWQILQFMRYQSTILQRSLSWKMYGLLLRQYFWFKRGLGPKWKEEGKCSDDPDFVEENCRYSCGICTYYDLCSVLSSINVALVDHLISQKYLSVQMYLQKRQIKKRALLIPTVLLLLSPQANFQIL